MKFSKENVRNVNVHIIKIREKVCENKYRKITENYKIWFKEKVNKIDKSFDIMNKHKEKTHFTNIRNAKGSRLLTS
jgi:hypothetical protein